MIVTASSNNGATTVISPRGEIDFTTLPDLLTAARKLPRCVTEVVWDLREAAFMDVAGLHLLVDQRLACRGTNRTLTVTGLGQQPQRLLTLVSELFPAEEWDAFLEEMQSPAAVGVSGSTEPGR
ncbi:STAS domain-containing protein [Peterkaempfera griseoplana]|uniref:STAS domain-containing protein n=1 Tax=Peterkaempfera griseoplana TaxID=66896 RepID=UPI0007C7F451|nr:STAS domain-containing protein [Peterkaempfera griseoplana]